MFGGSIDDRGTNMWRTKKGGAMRRDEKAGTSGAKDPNPLSPIAHQGRGPRWPGEFR